MYDFSTLSPLDFEDLVRDLLQAEMGVVFESFGPGTDLGIDLRFSADVGKTIVVQAKHYFRSGANALVRAAKDEAPKVKRLLPARYILATSVSMSPNLKKRIQTAMVGVELKSKDIIGLEYLNNRLQRHREVEHRHFKLWLSSTEVLDRILKSGVYNQTEAEMDYIKSFVPKFVLNESVSQAERILANCGTLVISGHPGVGKSTLARMLLWLHAEQGWRIAVVSDMREALEAGREGEKTFIFFDDFLGQVRLSTDYIREVDRKMPSMLRRVGGKENLRFIVTTRDYILHEAQAESSNLSSSQMQASEFVLDVGSYTRSVRARILFNHIFFSDISDEDRMSLLRQDFFLDVIDHPNFNPRLIDSLVSSRLVASGEGSFRDRMRRTLDNPAELWALPYRAHVSPYARIVLLAMFFHPHSVDSKDLEKSFARMVLAAEIPMPRVDVVRNFRRALNELAGSFLSIIDDKVDFSNPGVRDCMWRIVEEDSLGMTALEAVAEYEEILQTWDFFKAQIGAGKDDASALLADGWVNALKRFSQTASGMPIKRFALMLDVAEAFPLRFSEIGDLLISETDQLDVSARETDLCADILGLLRTSALSQRRILVVRICAAVRCMLLEEGGFSTLNDLDLLERRMAAVDDDPKKTQEAFKAAYEQYAEDLEIELESVENSDDLVDFEDDILTKLSDYGIDSTDAVRAISERRDEIDEAEFDSDYQPSTSTRRVDMSDDAIRSLFSTLKKR